MKFRSFLLAMMLCALCVTQASALEYDFDAPEDYLFGQPTSDDTIYEWEDPNVDRSKNTTLVAPGFGTPTSYLPGSGEYLTPKYFPRSYTPKQMQDTIIKLLDQWLKKRQRQQER